MAQTNKGKTPASNDWQWVEMDVPSGKVLSAGGIKEKSMAAQRPNIKTVVLPVGNRKDLTEMPEEVKTGLNFVLPNAWRTSGKKRSSPCTS